MDNLISVIKDGKMILLIFIKSELTNTDLPKLNKYIKISINLSFTLFNEFLLIMINKLIILFDKSILFVNFNKWKHKNEILNKE